MEYTWGDRLKDSSWVTIAWEWLQSLLGRAVDFVLWVTMIFACYQLIPGAPMPSQALSVFTFVLQFVALDIGGMSLNQIGQRHGLDRWSYTRVVAYACIFVTLVTIVFAGIQHAMTVPQDVTNWVEIILVVARSILTVLYGQAVRALKFVEQVGNDQVAKLEEEVSKLRVQLDSEQRKVSSGHFSLSTLQLELDRAVAEVSSLRVQLDGKNQQIASLQETLGSGMKLHEPTFRSLNR
jgi:hypothetical protein